MNILIDHKRMSEVKEHKKGKIYKIGSKKTGEEYNGATTVDNIKLVTQGGKTRDVKRVIEGGDWEVQLVRNTHVTTGRS